MTGAEEYARWVLDPENARDTGRLIKLAAQRFLDDLQREDIYFDEEEAIKMVNFGERYCCQWEGDWRDQLIKFELWQRFIFEQVYGWFVKSTGLRRFEEVYVQVSKKNGKSTMCAVLMNFHLIADERINTPKIFTAANNEEQAKICVNMAGRIIERSPDLYELVEDGTIRLFNYKDNITEVVNTEKDGFIKAFAKETSDKNSKTAGGKHGINASLGIVDEKGMAPDHGAEKPIKTSMASRKEGLMFKITTSGFNLEGPCYQEDRKVGIQVLEGVVKKDNYLPIIFEIDPPRDEEDKQLAITSEWLLNNPWSWKQSNPNVGVSVHHKFLTSALEDAIQYGGTTEVDNLTLNFNIWMHSADVFISADKWNKNNHGITEEELYGCECFGGIEIVSGTMLNAFVLLFPDVRGKKVIKPIFWMPEESLSLKDNDDLKDWIKKGFIHTSSGNVVDNFHVYEIIMQEINKYNLHSFAFKSNLVNQDIVQSLIKNGIEGNPLSHGYQGISVPTKEWEDILTKGNAEHFNNPVLAWMNSNCMAVRKDNEIRIEKSGSKVVGIYAGINALAQYKTIEATRSEKDGYIESW